MYSQEHGHEAQHEPQRGVPLQLREHPAAENGNADRHEGNRQNPASQNCHRKVPESKRPSRSYRLQMNLKGIATHTPTARPC